MTRRAVVKGVGHFLPDRVVPNSEFEKTIDTTDAWIKSRSGIERRHFAAPDETTSDLAIKAANAALANAGMTGDDIDAIVLATSTADLTFPSAATILRGLCLCAVQRQCADRVRPSRSRAGHRRGNLQPHHGLDRPRHLRVVR